MLYVVVIFLVFFYLLAVNLVEIKYLSRPSNRENTYNLAQMLPKK